MITYIVVAYGPQDQNKYILPPVHLNNLKTYYLFKQTDNRHFLVRKF